MLGKKARATSDIPTQSREDEGRKRKEEEERKATEKVVKEYNERTSRGGSLYSEHSKRKGEKGKEEEDDPSKRAFDREKDMGLGTKIGHKARAEMTREAKGFSGRFGAGGYL